MLTTRLSTPRLPVTRYLATRFPARRFSTTLLLATLLLLTCLAAAAGCGRHDRNRALAEPNLLSYSRIAQAQTHGRGAGCLVAILDWQFDLSGPEAEKYVEPTSLVPGEAIGELKPWHGEWMAEIVHTIAPEAKIMPIKARGLEQADYQDNVIAGIRLAADRGAVAVTCSMGPVKASPELSAAVDYAEARGTVFVNVHPEIVPGQDGKYRLCDGSACDGRILSTGVVSVPDHPAEPEPERDIYVWPYDLEAHWEDGWGYSNGPPTVAGVIALLKSAAPGLTPAEIRRLIVTTARIENGFAVLDAEAALLAAGAPAAGAPAAGEPAAEPDAAEPATAE